MTKTTFATLIAILAVLSMSSPSSAAASGECKKSKTGQTVGTVLGGLLGGVLGSQIDGGNKRGLGTVLGAVVGSLAGSELGKKLDKCEQEKVETATYAAVSDTGKGASRPQVWRSDARDDVYGTVIAAPATTLSDGRECRTVTRVSYIAGEEVREEPRMCRRPPEANWGVA